MKKIIVCLLVIFALCFAMVGCQSSQPKATEPAATLETTAPSETTTPLEITAPATIVSFEDITWTRETCDCVETICFQENGEFRYSCACGNPVNDADLCEGYSYNPETKTISLSFIEEVEAVSQIAVTSCDGNTLTLDFAGDLRTFQRAE